MSKFTNLDGGAKHLGTGTCRTSKPTNKGFTSLFNSSKQRPDKSIPTKIKNKHTKTYADTGANEDYQSASASRPLHRMKAEDEYSPPITRQSRKPTAKSADDFVESTGRIGSISQAGHSITAASGEGHCSGACAFIPVDVRPLIQQAYDGADFTYVDQAPVYLPMVDDDGVLRRENPTQKGNDSRR